MSLRKIVSTFVCLWLSLVCCGVRGSNSLCWNDTSCNAQYELKLLESGSVQGQCHIVCNMEKLKGAHKKKNMDYTITSNKWLSNKNYIIFFLNALKDVIVNLKGNFPNFDLVNNFANSLEQLFDNDKNPEIKEFNNTDEFLLLTKDEAEKLKRISFINCSLNTKFSDHVDVACIRHINTIEFINCTLDGNMKFAEILDSACNKNIMIKNCDLTDDDLIWVLNGIGNKDIDTIDVSNNLLTKDVISRLDKIIDENGISINRGGINLRGNKGITKDDIIQCEMEDFCHV